VGVAVLRVRALPLRDVLLHGQKTP
jgi:hypothetical protein